MQLKTNCPYFGVDFSSLDNITDEALLFSQIDFMWCRAYGSNHTAGGDTEMATFVTMARNNNCPVGSYYFGTPFVDASAGVSTDAQIIANAETQAQEFIDKLYLVYGEGQVGDLTPMLDLEQYVDNRTQYGHSATGTVNYPQAVMTNAQIFTWTLAFKNYFNSTTGWRLGMYTGEYWIKAPNPTEGAGLTTEQMALLNPVDDPLPLWVARYDEYNPSNDTVPNFGTWTEFSAWQYTGTGSASAMGMANDSPNEANNYLDYNRVSDMNMIYAERVTPETPTAGEVLPWDEMVKQLNLNTGFFETSRYTLADQMFITSGNWDDAGASFGNMQYNYGTADRAQELFFDVVTNYESVVRTHFIDQAKADEFINVTKTYTRAQRITWADGITDWSLPTDGHGLIQPWKDYFGNLLGTPECSAKYFQIMELYYLPNALDLFKGLSCTSRASLASIFDLSTNRGRFYPVNSLVVDFETLDANNALTEFEKEAEKIRIINNRGNDPSNGTSGATQTQFIPRRSCQAEQGGDYHGDLYDPEVQFNINQEPAIIEKASATSLGVKLGTIDVSNVFLGTTPISSIYLGAILLGSSTGELAPYESSKVPDTQFRTLENSYVGVESGAISLNANQPLWIDVQNWLACKTYYTIDGSTPTTASPVYYENLKFTESCTLKTLTVSVTGVAEAVKTATITVATAGVTTISPTSTTQNTIPFTVTLTNSAGATIYYKVGAGTQLTYTGPFSVNQTTNNVGANILVTYWSTGEAEKTITYNTSGAIAGKPVVTATPGNWYVRLDWLPTANTTSYNVYRSTVAGQLGTLVAQYQTFAGYDDNTAQNNTTYYYTVTGANYANGQNSDQVSATPATVQAPKSYRYIRQWMNGGWTGSATTYLNATVELQAISTASGNVLLNKVNLEGWPAKLGGTSNPASTITDGITTDMWNYAIWSDSTGGIPQKITYDMGQLYTDLTSVKVWHNFASAGRYYNFKIEVCATNSATPADWTVVVDKMTNSTARTDVETSAGLSYPIT